MNNPHGIIIFGANGSGKTTLGRELARILNFKHIDHEDYAFEKSDIPYAIKRSREDCINLMLADIERHLSFVLSAVTGDFGDIIPQYYKLAVYLSAPKETRIERIKQRAYEQHGERIHKGGDMYDQHLDFVNFVAVRSLSPIEQWAETLNCPVIEVAGTKDYHSNAMRIAEHYNKIAKNEVKLRKYNSDDCKAVWNLFYDTIHTVNSADYTDSQLDAWAPKDMDLHTWNERLLRNDYAIMAELNDTIVGIGTADDTGYFDLLYVHKDYQRMGIATLIANDIEKYLWSKGVQTISTDASITAKPFFENRGFTAQEK